MGAHETQKFFDFLMKKVEIGVLYVPQAEDANAVFEALNGRGKRLDDVDLIRNHLYSYFTEPSDSERRATIHEQLESVLATTRTATRSQEYFRCFFQCKYGYLQKKRFYRDTRAKIRDTGRRQSGDKHVYSLVHELANPASVELFRTISVTNPSKGLLDAFCTASGTSRNKRNLPVFIRELGGYKVVQPLMFALLRRFVEAGDQHRRSVAKAVHRCLSDLSSFVMRVSFCEVKFEPSKLEPGFANCASRITGISKVTDLDIKTDLEECDDLLIMDDTRFIARLLDVQMTDSVGLNACYSESTRSKKGKAGLSTTKDVPWNTFCRSRRPIGPAGPGSNRPDRTFGTGLPRIGNLTLLGDSGNHARHRFNANFAAKKPVFEASPFAMTRDVSRIEDWTPTAVIERSRKLARAAAHVWCFSGSDDLPLSLTRSTPDRHQNLVAKLVRIRRTNKAPNKVAFDCQGGSIMLPHTIHQAFAVGQPNHMKRSHLA